MIILTLSRFIDSMTKGSSSWCAVCCVVLKGVVLGGFWSECNQVSWSLWETKCSKPVGCMNNQESAEKQQQQQQPTNQPKKQTKAKTSKLKHLKGSRRLHPALTSLHTHTWHFSRFTHIYNNHPFSLYHLAWEFQKPFIISLICLICFIRPKINELYISRACWPKLNS